MSTREKNTAPLYQVSGLTYTLPKMLIAMGLILLGYAGLSMTISVTPTIVTLKLNELGISSTLLVFITTTIGQVFNMTVCQWVSFKSDRYRSKRWGRRVPFIFFTMPMICVSWLIIGFYREESELLSRILAPLSSLSPETLAIIVVATGIVIFKFFYMFVGSVFYYIYNDVIPPQVMTRFNGALQITASISSALYNYFIFKHTLEHTREVMIGFVVIYGVLMGAMCLFLKEPRFPDPESAKKKKSSGIFAFGKESFSHRIYWFNFLDTTFSSAAMLSAAFIVFHQQSMGLSMADIGNMNGTISLVRTGIAFLAASVGAVLIDRWHPIRISVFLKIFIFITICCETRWFFFTPPGQVFWWVYLLFNLAMFLNLFTGIAAMPTLQLIFPKSRFGQFCSARSLIASGAGLLFGLLMGGFFDFLKTGLELGEKAYRGLYFWQVACQGVAIVFCLLTFNQYRKLGGFKAYRAPAIWEADGYEKMEVSQPRPPSLRILRLLLAGYDLLFLLTVITPAVLGCFWKHWNSSANSADLYWMMNLPAAVIIAAAWLFLRNKISKNIKLASTGTPAQVPHHGVLLLLLLMRLIFQAVFVLEAVMTMKLSGEGTTAAGLNIYESAMDILMLAAIWLCMKFEDPVAETGTA
ncbi:MAG: hypothetical protein IKD10_04735 [Lentisphaeria bacterium]|nr:hypothetical protein [Lentisphaeria bacterium]